MWYFENEHGEQWVARREKDLLRIAGLDIGWKEIQLNAEQVMAEKERLQQEILLRQVMKIPELKKDGRSVPANSAFSYEYDT